MNCQNADNLLQKSLDEPLSLSERAALDSHLANCTACQAAWDEYRALARSTSAWVKDASASPISDDAFTAQLLSQIAAHAQPHRAHRPSRRWLLGSAACLCSVVAASIAAGPWIAANVTVTPNWLPTVTALRTMPQWLTANAHDTLTSLSALSNSVPHSLSIPAWTTSVLIAAVILNGLFFWRTITLNRRHTAS